MLEIFRTFLLILFAFSVGCSGSSGGGSGTAFPYSNSSQYFKTTEKIVVDVFYEPGAEPFTGTTAGGLNYWSILENNLNEIFKYRSSLPVVVVPKALASMTALSAQGKTSWLGTDIVALHNRTATTASTSSEAHFYLYFLKGYFNSGSGPSTSVIGVSISGTPIIALFKQVVQSTGNNPNGAVPKYVEQSTLVHELGHALGFVNNGVPMASNHQDTAHGAHTTDSNCVMYWQNEGAADLQTFVLHYILNNTTIMWGSAVLQDAQNFSQ